MEQIDRVKNGLSVISTGVKDAYLMSLIVRGIAYKDSLEEASSDLGNLERMVSTDPQISSNRFSQQIKYYHEIVNLLNEVPSEDLIRERPFLELLDEFTLYYNLSLKGLLHTNSQISPFKYKFLDFKGKYRHLEELESQNIKSVSKLRQIAEKYIELIKIL